MVGVTGSIPVAPTNTPDDVNDLRVGIGAASGNSFGLIQPDSIATPYSACPPRRAGGHTRRKDVNILAPAIVTRRFRVPLRWSVLSRPGNSNIDQRIALLRRYLALFDADSIDLLLADRAFIGAANG